MADYRYDYQQGISYPTNLPVDSAEGCFVSSDLPPRNQIYSTTLMNLSKKTSTNLEILKAKLIAADPCYEYGPQHWHPNRKWEEYEEFSNDILENTRSKYDQHGVVFTSEKNIKQLGYVNGQPKSKSKPKSKNKACEAEEKNETEFVNPFCYLCTTVDEHKQHMARRGPQFKAKEKTRPRIQYIAPPPFVKSKPKEEEEKAEVLYKVSVTTGTQPLAATSAKVSFILRGKDGVMKKRQLTKKSSVQFTFGRGTTENFFIKGPKIGQLRSLTIEHDGLEKKHSWYVEEITVTVISSGQVFVFPCKQWLSLYLGDMRLKRTLQAHVQEMMDRGADYEVTITTADKFGAGTDANVFLTIYGKKGISPKFPLRNKSKNNFEAGHDDKFKVSVERDIGTLSKIRLEHDNTGVGAGWFVEKVVLMDSYTGQSWTFPCGQWLAKDEGDRRISRDLMPLPGQQRLKGSTKSHRGKKGRDLDSGPQLWYEFIVGTGTRRHAGTDAHVFVTLLGALGKSQEVPLDDGKDHFEKGQTDVFKRRALDVGELKRIIVRHDNAGLAAGWFLEKIVIKRFFSAQEVRDRLSMMAGEMQERVSNITGEDMPGTPTKKRRELRHKNSVSFEDLREQEKKEKKKKKKHRWEDDSDEEEEEEDWKGPRRNKWDDDENRNRKGKKGWDEEEEEGERRRNKRDDYRDKKKDKKKHKWDEEEEEERKRRKDRSSSRRRKDLARIDEENEPEKRKKKYRYQGIEVEATESESDEEYRSKHSKKERKKKNKGKKCYVDTDTESEDERTYKKYDSDTDSETERKQRSKQKKNKKKYDTDTDSETERKQRSKQKKNKKKYDTDTDSETEQKQRSKQKKNKKKTKKESSTSESSSTETDEEVYTKWTKGRVPYCDEYVFEFNRWLATDEDDGLLQREARPKTVTTFYKIDD